MFETALLMKKDGAADVDETDVVRPRVAVAVMLFASIAVVMAIDLADDWSTGADSTHLGLEFVVMVLAAAGAAALWRGMRTAQVRAVRLGRDLEVARAEAARYRAEAGEALEGLGQAIDRQFERWALTPAEREVGLLLLKGLSHREIAEVRTTSEPTVRQQALAVYRKSGLRNRSELSAFFLEDLLLPRTE